MPIQIHIPKREIYDEEKEMFIDVNEYNLTLEHSLLSISKWESKWHVPYITKKEKTSEQVLDYIRCMNTGKPIPEEVYNYIPGEELDKIVKYINDPMTATTVKTRNNEQNREILTSEVIYYYMFECNIPKECERWHINRLMTLIGVFGVKRDTGTKLSRSEAIARNKMINERNKAKYHTRG